MAKFIERGAFSLIISPLALYKALPAAHTSAPSWLGSIFAVNPLPTS